MFKVKKENSILILADDKEQTIAKIALNNEGARLISLRYDNRDIIKDLEHKPYSLSQAGAILFPFANRVKDGTYNFKGETYQLECNEPNARNAIHGLVFNKTFSLDVIDEKADHAIARLSYTEKNPPAGFPFKYDIEATYTLNEAELILKITVLNIGDSAFPFNLGWHPYFCIDDFDNSFLAFDSHKEVIFDDDMIATGISETMVPNPYSLKDKTLDDCFALLDKTVEFNNGGHKITIEGKPKSQYLQIYAPPGEKRLAIEPMTGISDSFNHKRGVHILKPYQEKSETWKITFKH
jgi:aldose 1-epimerase